MKRVSVWLRDRVQLRWFPWAALGTTGAIGIPVALLVMLGTWLEHQGSPPTCYGIGWGCTLDPLSSGLIIGFFWFVALGGLALALAVTEPFWERVAVARSVVAVLVTCTAAIALLVLAFATVMAALD